MMFCFRNEKFPGDLRDTGTTRKEIGINDRKCTSCELWCKQNEKKNRNGNILSQRKEKSPKE